MAKAQKPTGEKVSRSQLHQAVAEAFPDIPKREIIRVLNTQDELVCQHLRNGSNVATGLGTFKRKDKPAKPARKAFTGPDPFNKGAMKDFPARPAQPAKAASKFQPGKAIREALA